MQFPLRLTTDEMTLRMKEWVLCGYRVSVYEDSIFIWADELMSYILQGNCWVKGVPVIASWDPDDEYEDPTGEGRWFPRARKGRR